MERGGRGGDAVRVAPEMVGLHLSWGGATRLADHAGLDPHRVGCAGLVHSLGRVSVPNATWERTGELRSSDRGRISRYPATTDLLLERSSIATLRDPAAWAQERLDGSGYHRQAVGASPEARVLAVALVWEALRRNRPHRPALPADQARRVLEEQAEGGRLDRRLVEIVTGAGPTDDGRPRPAGLTEREVQVLRLAALGYSKKAMATELGISRHTADTHLRHVYEKLGVTTRAAAAVYAMRHGIVDDPANA